MDDVLDFPRDGDSPAISASWVCEILRSRLGCVDIGWRDEMSWVWVTPNGVAFQVADPAAELLFSTAYARELIGRIREITRR